MTEWYQVVISLMPVVTRIWACFSQGTSYFFREIPWLSNFCSDCVCDSLNFIPLHLKGNSVLVNADRFRFILRTKIFTMCGSIEHSKITRKFPSIQGVSHLNNTIQNLRWNLDSFISSRQYRQFAMKMLILCFAFPCVFRFFLLAFNWH